MGYIDCSIYNSVIPALVSSFFKKLNKPLGIYENGIGVPKTKSINERDIIAGVSFYDFGKNINFLFFDIARPLYIYQKYLIVLNNQEVW
jgi:hypothetical protein